MTEHDSVLKILIPLLRFELTSERECSVKPEDLTPEILEALYRHSKNHDLAHMVGRALERLNLLDPSSQTTKNFNNKQFAALYRYEHMTYEASQIFRVLEENSIAYVPLKGAVVRELYPDKWLRTSCDIDVLIHESDLKKASEALRSELAYTEKERSYNEVSFISGSCIHLELHFNILANIPELDTLLSRVWEFAELEDGFKYRYHLTNEFFAFHLISHMLYHFIGGGCGIRSVCDIWLLKSKGLFNEEKLLEMFRNCNAEPFASAILYLSDVWFSDAEENELTVQMQRFILNGGAYGNTENRVFVQNVRKGNKFRYVTSRLVVPYGTLKHRYPILVKHKWMLPIYQVRRWFALFGKKERRRTLNELKKNSEINANQLEITADFLKKLGLNQ